MKKILLTVLLIAGVYGSSSAQDLTAANWRKDPRIAAIRTIVAGIENAIKAGDLRRTQYEFEDPEPGQDREREIFTDKQNRIRKIIRSGGSDDSALTRNFYFDQDGRLRFVFITGGAVNGTSIEHRIYLDASGRRLYEYQTLLEGPGYTFPDVWPEEALVLRAADFSLTEQ
jgi:hypothetical protein